MVLLLVIDHQTESAESADLFQSEPIIFFVVTTRKIEDRFQLMTLSNNILLLGAVQSQEYRVSMMILKRKTRFGQPS